MKLHASEVLTVPYDSGMFVRKYAQPTQGGAKLAREFGNDNCNMNRHTPPPPKWFAGARAARTCC